MTAVRHFDFKKVEILMVERNYRAKCVNVQISGRSAKSLPTLRFSIQDGGRPQSCILKWALISCVGVWRQKLARVTWPLAFKAMLHELSITVVTTCYTTPRMLFSISTRTSCRWQTGATRCITANVLQTNNYAYSEYLLYKHVLTNISRSRSVAIATQPVPR